MRCGQLSGNLPHPHRSCAPEEDNDNLSVGLSSKSAIKNPVASIHIYIYAYIQIQEHMCINICGYMYMHVHVYISLYF